MSLKVAAGQKKKVAVAAAPRNSQLRDDWVARISQYQPQQLMFLDESAANEKTPSRSTGWSTLNVMPCIQRILKRSERWSILPAYTLNGYITYELIQGSFDTRLATVRSGPDRGLFWRPFKKTGPYSPAPSDCNSVPKILDRTIRSGLFII